MSQLPVLDFTQFAKPETREQFLSDLRHAARDYGFFYLKGHGVSPTLQARLIDVSQQFFALPEADKLAIEMVNSPHFRGYTRAGQEITRGQQDWREQIDIGSELPVSPVPADQPWLRLQGPNLWPAALPEFRKTLLEWQSELTRVSIDLLRAFALALGQDEDVFAQIYRGIPSEHLKVVRYPAQTGDRSSQGVGAHKDSGFLTLLLQDDVGGLQVEASDGSWIDAVPIDGTFIINIGEILELASNGYLRATVHRVVSPSAGRDRLSIPYFFGADLNATVPLLNLSEHLAREATGPASDPLNPLFRDVGRNYLKGRLRSHPDVAARHYADLLAKVG
ncbi:isopenicillin N synthase family oxygenase [Devosia sp. 2618]|uniref:isopenicillin N synthase family dioxygenase n=1 Tax=Devosia sp. 2618 TaxID=3156454 RepID=UPI003396F0AE